VSAPAMRPFGRFAHTSTSTTTNDPTPIIPSLELCEVRWYAAAYAIVPTVGGGDGNLASRNNPRPSRADGKNWAGPGFC
jgi:hypothetical protein